MALDSSQFNPNEDDSLILWEGERTSWDEFPNRKIGKLAQNLSTQLDSENAEDNDY